ncbi:UNKNOWN [Stylonychia lemnae]|uniref:Transmembrane protein n=1 Tax=Stylonychia lemnae TaxID=5949 RepID=A0A077ZQG1_STYLE|nr:UNKNOWN [Stylonychia lemnae]|eukprot:CDW72148.1 UNKNOWN [Stylonychia lemnae]
MKTIYKYSLFKSFRVQNLNLTFIFLIVLGLTPINTKTEQDNLKYKVQIHNVAEEQIRNKGLALSGHLDQSYKSEPPFQRRQLATNTSAQDLYTCGQCIDNRLDYCQPKSKGIFFLDTKGVCEDSSILKALYPTSPYYCSDQFYTVSTYEFFAYFPCPFFTQKCGMNTNILNMTESEQNIETSLLEQGDVCVFEINYKEVDNNLKIWPTKLSNVEVTIADGFNKHPYQIVSNFTFISLLLKDGDEFEVGDAWYNMTYGGKAYLFIKATSTYGQAKFTYGQKNLIPQWVIIVIIVGSVVVGLGCLAICFCYVRRLYIKKRSQSKVQKFGGRQETIEERISKYKYKGNSQRNTLMTQNFGPQEKAFDPDFDYNDKEKLQANQPLQQNYDFSNLQDSTQSNIVNQYQNNSNDNYQLPGQL